MQKSFRAKVATSVFARTPAVVVAVRGPDLLPDATIAVVALRPTRVLARAPALHHVLARARLVPAHKKERREDRTYSGGSATVDGLDGTH